MKVFAVLLLIATAVCAKSVHTNNVIQAEGPPCPIPDPLFGPGPAPFNASLHPIFEIFEGGSRGDINSVGLSTLWYNVTIQPLLLTARFHLKLGSIDMTTDFTGEGWVDARPLSQETIPSGNFTGGGPVKVTASDIEVKGSATLFPNLITNKVTVRILTVETVSFGSVYVNLSEGFLIAGEPVDWETWSAGFVENWNADFQANHAPVVEKIRTAANVIIGQYTLAELIDLIGDGGGEPTTCAPETNH